MRQWTAEVSFTSTEYDALGVKVGMTLDEAENILTEAGCTKDSDGLYVFGNVAAIRLTVENGTVAVRRRGEGDIGAMNQDEFIAMLQKEIAEKK